MMVKDWKLNNKKRKTFKNSTMEEKKKKNSFIIRVNNMLYVVKCQFRYKKKKMCVCVVSDMNTRFRPPTTQLVM